MRSLLTIAFFLCGAAAAQNVTDLGTNSQLSTACPPNQGSNGASTATYATYAFLTVCQGADGVLAPWGGGDINTRVHLFIAFGGGHVDYNGNAPYALNYHPGSVGWARLWNDSAWCANGNGHTSDSGPQCGGSGGAGVAPNYDGALATYGTNNCSYNGAFSQAYYCFLNADGTPVPGHLFGAGVYLPTQNTMFVSLSGNPGGQSSSFTWQFGCGSSAWVNGDCAWMLQSPTNGQDMNLNGATGSSGKMSAYDAADDVVWSVDEENGNFYKYAPATNTTTYVGQISADFGQMESAVDPDTHVLWGMGNNAPHTAFQAAYVALDGTNNFHDVSSALSGTCASLIFSGAVGFPGMAWDPIQHKFILIAPGVSMSQLVIFDPVAMSCSALQLTGASLPAWPSALTASGSNGPLGKFRYTGDLQGAFLYVPPSDQQDAYLIQVDAIPPGGLFPLPAAINH